MIFKDISAHFLSLCHRRGGGGGLNKNIGRPTICLTVAIKYVGADSLLLPIVVMTESGAANDCFCLVFIDKILSKNVDKSTY